MNKTELQNIINTDMRSKIQFQCTSFLKLFFHSIGIIPSRHSFSDISSMNAIWYNINENQTIEFKTSFDKEAIESITAFANTNGGVVYIGVNPTMKFKFKETSGGFLTKLLYTKQKITTKDVTKDVTKNERLSLIVKIINKNINITVDEIANKLNVNRRTILRDMENLQKQNKIKRIGGRKIGHWEVVK